MDYKSLKCFCDLAQSLNFRESSARLNMSQPALSVRIQRLEDELGFLLFHRSATGVSLTKEGDLFLPQAMRSQVQMEHLVEEASQIRRGNVGRLRIAYTPLSFFTRVPELIQKFSSSNPDVEIVLEERLSEDIEEALSLDYIDAGFLHGPLTTDELSFYELQSDEFLAAIPQSNPLAQLDVIPFKKLSEENLILVSETTGPYLFQEIIATCHHHKFTPKIRQQVATSIGVLGLVAAGYGIGFVISSLQDYTFPGLQFRPLKNGFAPLTTGLAIRDAEDNPIIQNLIQFASREFQLQGDL
ncbi:MAG: LysR family transcriptional regulator [Rhizobiales bacterium]|nr:LysR family transcriptional regulator [Hyphomicrobiales bacterium]